MSETSGFRHDDTLPGEDVRRDDLMTDEGRRPEDGELTTEQLAEAGASPPAEPVSEPVSRSEPEPAESSADRAAADPRERDAGGMPMTPADGTSPGSPTFDSAASAAESDATARSDASARSEATGVSAPTGRHEAAQLLEPQDRDAMTSRWRDIQADFVDHPRQAMKDADTLVAGLMQQLAQMFAQERAQLEAQWSRGDEVSTEDLRVSLQRYRAFFERLLSI
jgi:hypothetical protein